MPAKDIRRYIIMSNEGFLSDLLTATELVPSAKTVNVMARAAAVAPAPKMQVLDSLHENGPKLVEMSPEAELSLRLSVPGLKIVPEVFYHRQWERFKIHQRLPKAARKAVKKAGRKMMVARAAAAPASAIVSIADASDGAPIQGAQIVAFTDFASRQGASATTGANGRATLNGLSSNRKLERVYVYAPSGYWGFFAQNTTGSKLAKIKLAPINVREPSLLLSQLYGALPANAGNGITVAIIDSGVDGTHPDLKNVTGGLNCVSDEVRADPAAAQNWRPAVTEGEHGTHVAGIVGGHGAASGFRGVAPGVKLRSYRVFPDHPRPPPNDGASNFDIAKAIDTAIADKCDIINMSLGGDDDNGS
jgi:subtilisin